MQVLLQDPAHLLYHGEVLRRNGQVVGDVRAGSYGHTLGGAVGLAMATRPSGEPATKAWFDAGDWEVEVAGSVVPATVSLRPLFDPANTRVKC